MFGTSLRTIKDLPQVASCHFWQENIGKKKTATSLLPREPGNTRFLFFDCTIWRENRKTLNRFRLESESASLILLAVSLFWRNRCQPVIHGMSDYSLIRFKQLLRLSSMSHVLLAQWRPQWRLLKLQMFLIGWLIGWLISSGQRTPVILSQGLHFNPTVVRQWTGSGPTVVRLWADRRPTVDRLDDILKIRPKRTKDISQFKITDREH